MGPWTIDLLRMKTGQKWGKVGLECPPKVGKIGKNRVQWRKVMNRWGKVMKSDATLEKVRKSGNTVPKVWRESRRKVGYPGERVLNSPRKVGKRWKSGEKLEKVGEKWGKVRKVGKSD